MSNGNSLLKKVCRHAPSSHQRCITSHNFSLIKSSENRDGPLSRFLLVCFLQNGFTSTCVLLACTTRLTVEVVSIYNETLVSQQSSAKIGLVIRPPIL